MRYYIFLLVLTMIACNSESAENETTVSNTIQDSSDEHTFMDGEYEMKQYYFVMLTKGEKRKEISDTALINDLQKRHLANIDSLANEGKILVAGPFGDDGNWRGIFIFDADTQEEVEAYLNTDPMINAGWLGYEVHPWWTAKNEVFK